MFFMALQITLLKDVFTSINVLFMFTKINVLILLFTALFQAKLHYYNFKKFVYLSDQRIVQIMFKESKVLPSRKFRKHCGT